MKCFYIGDFSKSYSTELYITKALRKIGVDVKAWQQDLQIPFDHLVDRIVAFNPDFVLFCKGGKFPQGHQVIKKLKALDILTVTWLFDLYHNLPREMLSNRSLKEFQFSADIVFTSDGGSEWGDINHHVLRQGICDEETDQGIKGHAPGHLERGRASSCAARCALSGLRAERTQREARPARFDAGLWKTQLITPALTQYLGGACG